MANGSKGKLAKFAPLFMSVMVVTSAGYAYGKPLDQEQLRSCYSVCTNERVKELKYCDNKWESEWKKKGDDNSRSKCIKRARDDEDMCDRQCDKKYGK